MSKPMSATHEACRMVRETAPELLAELELLDRRADDVAVKAGATLAFDGLLVAAGLVVLSAESGTSVHAAAGEPAALISAAALVVLFVASILSLLAIGRGRARMGEHAEAVIFAYDRRLMGHERTLSAATVLTLIGALGLVVAFAWIFGRGLGLAL